MFNVDGCERDGAVGSPNDVITQGLAFATPVQTASVPLDNTAVASSAMTVTPAAVFQFLRLAATRTPGLALTT